MKVLFPKQPVRLSLKTVRIRVEYFFISAISALSAVKKICVNSCLFVVNFSSCFCLFVAIKNLPALSLLVVSLSNQSKGLPYVLSGVVPMLSRDEVGSRFGEVGC